MYDFTMYIILHVLWFYAYVVFFRNYDMSSEFIIWIHFCSLGKNSVFFHSFLHLDSNIGICLMIQGCFEKECPLLEK